MNMIGNLSLEIPTMPIAVLTLLSGYSPPEEIYDEEIKDFHCDITTGAWYNCRESGFSLKVRSIRIGSPILTILCYTHRNTDALMVAHWISEAYLNPPTPQIFPEDAWRQAKDFGENVTKCADYIYGLIEKFFKERKGLITVKVEEVR